MLILEYLMKSLGVVINIKTAKQFIRMFSCFSCQGYNVWNLGYLVMQSLIKYPAEAPTKQGLLISVQRTISTLPPFSL